MNAASKTIRTRWRFDPLSSLIYGSAAVLPWCWLDILLDRSAITFAALASSTFVDILVGGLAGLLSAPTRSRFVTALITLHMRQAVALCLVGSSLLTLHAFLGKRRERQRGSIWEWSASLAVLAGCAWAGEWLVYNSPSCFSDRLAGRGLYTSVVTAGQRLSDFDDDGHGLIWGQKDCDPFNAQIHPGAHGSYDHSNGIYSELTHVPLIVTFPGIEKGSASQVTSLLYLTPTLLAMLVPDKMPAGKGLYMCLGQSPCHSLSAPMALKKQNLHFHGLVMGDYHIIRDVTRDHLWVYHLAKDPQEQYPIERIPAQLESALVDWEERAMAEDDVLVRPYCWMHASCAR